MTDFERKLAALMPATVDRDAMLFAAGRASAPSPRWWPWAYGVLAATQAVTLGLWLHERQGSTPPSDPPPAALIPDTPVPLPTPPDPSSYLVLLRTWDDRPPPPEPDGWVEPRRSLPLTAGSNDF